MADDLISIENLSIGYDGNPVLSDISLSIAHGSFTGLLGSNGSGKSTLIKTVLGIIPPLSGQIRFTGKGNQPPVLGYVPQRETLDPIYLLSSFEVVLMGACGRVGPGCFLNKEEREWARHCVQEAGAEGFSRK